MIVVQHSIEGVREAICGYLTNGGYKCTGYADVQATWQSLRDGNVDVLVCNANESAVESDLIERVKRKYPGIAVIGVGARTFDSFPDGALSKIDGYIMVPFDAQQLIDSVRRVLIS